MANLYYELDHRTDGLRDSVQRFSTTLCLPRPIPFTIRPGTGWASLGKSMPSLGLHFLIYKMGFLGKITSSFYIVPPNYF